MQYEPPLAPYQPPTVDPQVLGQLRAVLAGDEALQLAVAQVENRHAAIAALVAVAANRGLAVDPAALSFSLQEDLLGSQFAPPSPINRTDLPGRDWLPIGLASDGEQLAVDWGHFAGRPLREPFFEPALRRARSNVVTRLLRWRTPLGSLLDSAELAATPPPAGLVFHMSRCGSTLVAQALGHLPGAIVLSEAAPLDEIVDLGQSRADLRFELRAALLRSMAAALARDRSGQAGQHFIKADCWHAAALPLYRAAFPQVPWIFLYREPVAVMQSQERMLGSQALPGKASELLGLTYDDNPDFLDFGAQVLAATCHAAADHAALGGGEFIDYAELPEALFSRILPHFGLSGDAAARALMAPALARDAKSPSEAFDRASRGAAADASDKVKAVSEHHLAPAVARLIALNRQTAD